VGIFMVEGCLRLRHMGGVVRTKPRSGGLPPRFQLPILERTAHSWVAASLEFVKEWLQWALMVWVARATFVSDLVIAVSRQTSARTFPVSRALSDSNLPHAEPGFKTVLTGLGHSVRLLLRICPCFW